MLDDRKGSVGQAKGICQAIGDRLEIIEKNIVYNRWAFLPNWLRGRGLLGVNKAKSDDLSSNYPDIVMSISRRTVPVARYIRKSSGNQTQIVQLMYPDGGIGLKEMALVIVPKHDSAKKQNIKNGLTIVGAPTRIFSSTLEQAKSEWNEAFATLPRPLTAVIIGGAIKGTPWPLDCASELADKIKDLHDKIGGSLLLTTSRRTGEAAQNLILQKLQGIPMYTHVWGEKKDNPLMGFYAYADRIVVTADSVSMCSEACGTGAPVLLYLGKNWLPEKHQKFAHSLIENDFAIDINSPQALDFKSAKTLNSAIDIADKIVTLAA